MVVLELMAETLTVAKFVDSGPESVVRANSTEAFAGWVPKFAITR